MRGYAFARPSGPALFQPALLYCMQPRGSAGTGGLELVSEFRALRPTYYWWFQDNGAEEFQPLSRCPACKNVLLERYGRHVCEQSFIVVANEKARRR